MRRPWLPVLLACALVLGGCSASNGSSTSGAVEGGAAPAAAQDAGGKDAVTADADRQVVVTGQVDVSVTDPLAAASKVAALVEQVGGHIQERQEQAARDGNDGSASLVARIPADRVSSTLDRLGDIGEVVASSLSSTEVTAQARDLDARIRALQISIGRLEDLLKRSGSVADVVSAEQVLTDRQSQLEQLQSQRASLAEQVALSTITIQLWADGTVPSEPPTGFLSGLASGWHGLLVTGRAVLTLLGVLLPWLVVAGLLIAAALPLQRRLKRRNAAMAPRSAPTTPGTGGPAPVLPLTDYPGPPVPPGASPMGPSGPAAVPPTPPAESEAPPAPTADAADAADAPTEPPTT